MDTLLIDGITGPTGECTCNHCQMDQVIDAIMARQEEHYDQATAPVFAQIHY